MNPLWTKSPLLLLRAYRKVFVAVLGSAVLLGLASMAGPLFLSSSGSAALADQLADQAPLISGMRIGVFDTFATPEARERLTQRSDLLAATIGSQRYVGEPVITLLGPDRDISAAGGSPDTSEAVATVRLISRSGAGDHVRILKGDASGALIADTTVEELRDLEPGDEITLPGAERPIEVTGIYRSLSETRVDPYWFNLGGLIFPDPNAGAPPPFLLLGEDAFFDLAADLELSGNSNWEFPIQRRGLTLPQAQQIAVYMQGLTRAVNEGEDIGGEEIASLAAAFENGQVLAGFAPLVRLAQETVTALEGPVLVLSLAGRLVALAVMAAGGAYLVVARRTEAQLLMARGITAWQQGLRSALEAIVPGAIGVAIGGFAGALLVKAVGPSDLIASEDVSGAVLQSVYTFVAGLAALAVSAAVSVRAQTTPAHESRNRFLTRIPWELPLLILAAAAFYEINTRDTVIIESSDGDRIDIFVLLFPILALLAMAGITARAVKVVFGKLRSIGNGDSSATYLATRRLAAAPGSIIGLLIASILSVGILVYAQSLAETIKTSTEAKAGVFVGSDVELLVYATAEIPDDFPLPATKVRKILRLSMTNGTRFTMLGIDRDSFAGAAFWDESFADRPLNELLDSLEPRGDAPLPVLALEGDAIESEPAIDLATDIPLDPVHRVRAFPGQSADEAIVVADIDGMNELFRGAASSASANAEDLIWARGSLNEVLGAAAEANISVGLFNSKEQVLARPTLSSVTWAFDLLRALGIAAGGIALLAVLLYMQARQRSTSVAYAMARRMGLSRVQHALSLGLELAAVLAVAAVAGTLLAVAIARLLYRHLDLLNTIPPEPLLRIPGIVIIAIFGIGVLAAIAGAVMVQRGADKARIAEVLRLAE